jgi:hypothetical protein
MNQTLRQGIPLRGDYSATQRAALDSLVRAAFAQANAALNNSVFAADVVREHWPDDRTAALLTRAASTPHSLTDPAVAPLLATSWALLAALTPVSAAAALLNRSLQLSFDGTAVISMPSITPALASFVGEGAPIPVVMATTGPGTQLRPRKFAVAWSLTREMVEASSNGEAVIRQSMLEATAAQLDAALFSNTAGDATRPPGILNGITPLSASTGSGSDVMLSDFRNLAEAVAPVAGSGVVYVMGPGEAVAVNMTAIRTPGPILVSNALRQTVIAIVPSALASAVDAATVEASREALMHMETAPAPIGTPGSPNVVAAPTRSMWQTDSVGLKLRMPVAWASRGSAAVAWISNTTW